MTLLVPRLGAVGLALCAGLATLAGCTTGGSTTHAATTSTSTTSTMQTTAIPTTTMPTTPPTLGPQSVAIVGRSAVGGDLVLHVTAPANTRFRIGTSADLAVACPATIERPGDPTAYRVVCPASPRGSELIATIALGDFDYSFSKPL